MKGNKLYKGMALGAAAMASLLSLEVLAQIEEGRYQMVSRHSGLAVSVENGSSADGANIVQHSLSGNANQQFDVEDMGNGYYSIRPVHSGKSLDVYNFSVDPGGEIRQWSFTGGDNQQWQIVDVGSGYHKVLSRHSGLALDVWEWSTASGGDIRQWSDTGAANQQWAFQPVRGDTGGGEACLDAPVGFASLGGGTTGGAGGAEVTVSNGQQLEDALSSHVGSSTPLTIYVNGTISQGNSNVNKFDVKDMENISIIGVGNNGVLDGIGIKIWRASNVIIRNLTIRYVREGEGDGISVEGPSNNIWIDHNTIHNSLDVDKDYYDGLVDITRNSNNISVTYNYLHDSWKTALTGHSDGNSDNNRRVTYAFNRWENTFSRTPLIRYSDTHLFNNYYNNVIDTGINSRMGARVRIDNNVFENSRNPIVSCYSSEIGYWDTSGNSFSNITWESGGDCVIAGPDVGSTISYNPPYGYSLLPTGQVKSHVIENAGAGRCNF